MWKVGLLAIAVGCGSSSSQEPPAPDAAVVAFEDVVTGLSEPRELAVDGSQLYVTHGGGEIARVAKTGGTISSIATGQRGPTSLDATTDRLCWVNSGTHAQDFLDGSVHCAPKTGGQDTQLADSFFPSGLAIDGTSIYWVEIDGHLVRTIGMDGTGAQTLDSSQTSKTAIAISGGTLAWTASGDGADVVILDRGTGATTTLSSSEYAPGALAISGTDVFWVVRHSLSDDGAIRVSRDRGAPVDLAPAEAAPSRLVLVDGTLYWTTPTAIRSIATTGGTARTIVDGRGSIGGLASDGEYLYWTEPDRGAIVRVRR